jgi:hypothetical protein
MLAAETKHMGYDQIIRNPPEFRGVLLRLCDHLRDCLHGTSASSIWSIDEETEKGSIRNHSAASNVGDRATPFCAVPHVYNGRVARRFSEMPLPLLAARSARTSRTRSRATSPKPTTTKKKNPLSSRRGSTKKEREAKEDQFQRRILFHHIENHQKELRYHMEKLEEYTEQAKKLEFRSPADSDDEEDSEDDEE